MLFLLLAWVYIFVLSTAYGLLAVNLLARLRKKNQLIPEVAPEIIGLAGFCTISWLLSLAHFFSAINIWVHAVLLAGAAISWFLHFHYFRKAVHQFQRSLYKPAYFWGLLLAFGLLTLLHALQTPAFPDTGSYHAQFIQWLQQYRIVPG